MMPTRQLIEWQFPLPRTHTGIAMGNGLLGVLLWGKDRIHITLNRADFWDHRGEYRLTEGVSTYEHIKTAYRPDDASWIKAVFPSPPKKSDVYCPSRLPFGRFELELQPGCLPIKGELNLANGTVTIRVATKGGKKSTKAIMFDLSVNRSVLWIRDPDHVVRNVFVRTAWEWVREWLKKYGFPDPVMVAKTDMWGWAQACPADPALAAICRQIKNGYLIALERGASAGNAIDAARELAEKTRAEGGAALRKTNTQWWQAYWKKTPQIALPVDFLNKFYRYALYKFGAATNPHCPWPAGWQGPWVEEYQPPPWQGDYHYNVNVQQVYSLAFAGNHLEHLMPLFDRLDSCRDVLRHNARVVCGIDDGLIIGMCSDDRGEMLYGGPGVVIDHACSGWTAQLFWHYYLYTGDEKFLRERAYPFMQGVMRVYEAMLEEKDGRLSLPLSISAEFGNDIAPRFMGRDPSWQLACMHMLANALQEAARILKTPPRPIWQRIKEKLPPYTLIGKPGEERIAVWEGQDLDFCHRHHSHLSCIYPFDSLGELTPEKRRIVENSVDHWISKGMGKWSEWCMPWAAIIQARLGFKESPWLILQLWRKLFVNEGLATVYLSQFRGLTVHRKKDQKKSRETNEIMQLDGTMGGATALCEMLIHTRGGITHIFPAVPDDWENVSFADIRVPGAFLVSAKRKNGRLQPIAIRSLIGGILTVQVDGYTTMLLKKGPGKNIPVQLPVRLTCRPNETVILSGLSR